MKLGDSDLSLIVMVTPILYSRTAHLALSHRLSEFFVIFSLHLAFGARTSIGYRQAAYSGVFDTQRRIASL